MRRLGIAFLILVNVQIFLRSQDTYTSFQSGNWADESTWSGAAGIPGANDTVIIQEGHRVSIATGNGESVYSMNIESGGVLDMQNKTFSVGGTLIVDGTLTSMDNSAKDIDFNGNILGGSGTIAINDESRFLVIASDAVILPTSSLHLFGNITVGNGVTVTNRGEIEVFGDLDGTDAVGSVWTNDDGSGVKASGMFLR